MKLDFPESTTVEFKREYVSDINRGQLTKRIIN